MSKYDELANSIIQNIGGASNIRSLTHCMTRLRFCLKDEKKAKTNCLEHTEGITAVIQSGGQYMLVIGQQVPTVYQAVCRQAEINPDSSGTAVSSKGSPAGLLARLKYLFSSLCGRKMESSCESPSFFYTVISPLSGIVRPLEQIDDPVFSSEALGKGCAIEPFEGEVFAPFDATVVQVAPTGHAIGLAGKNGVELLIHVGMETIELDGRYFEPQVHAGDTVKQGQSLLRFDMLAISASGYALTTPVVIVNTDEYSDIRLLSSGKTTVGQSLLALTPSIQI